MEPRHLRARFGRRSGVLERELGRRLPPWRGERVVIRWGATLKRFGSFFSSSTYVLVRCDLVWLGVPYWRNRRTAPHYTEFLLHVLKERPCRHTGRSRATLPGYCHDSVMKRQKIRAIWLRADPPSPLVTFPVV